MVALFMDPLDDDTALLAVLRFSAVSAHMDRDGEGHGDWTLRFQHHRMVAADGCLMKTDGMAI